MVSQYFWPENFRVNDLVLELSNRGHEITVLTGYPNYPDGKIFDDFKKNPMSYARYENVAIIRVPLMPRHRGALRLAMNYASFVLSACSIGVFKLRRKKFDRIFVFEPSPITVGIPAILFRRLKNAPIAFWVLDLWPDSLKAVGVVKSQFILRLVGNLVSFIYNRCDIVLGQSRSFVDQIRRYCRKETSVEFFPSWAEEIFTDMEKVEPASELKQFGGKFKIMFAGNIGEAQDFPAILDAAEHLKLRKDIHWLIVGDGRSSDWVKNEIIRRDLTDTVSMLGRFSLDRMPSFFIAADALLVSLRDSEVFSLTIPGKVQSYLAAGKPLLGMLNGEGASVILNAQAGLVCSAGAGQELARATCELVDMSQDKREAMGRAGYAFYMKEFRREALIARLEQILLNLNLVNQ